MVKRPIGGVTDGLAAVEAACIEALAESVHSTNVVLKILSRRRKPCPVSIIWPGGGRKPAREQGVWLPAPSIASEPLEKEPQNGGATNAAAFLCWKPGVTIKNSQV
jgi:hypothetical protein